MALPENFCIVSGGQTGADRAALDFAIRHGIAHGGWCPRGRLAEDGPLEAKYQLQETASAKYPQRTKWNVRDSDATIIFILAGEPTGGTALTLKVARNHGKPHLLICREKYPTLEEAGQELLSFLEEHKVERLNVAGPRASQEPEIADFVEAVLESSLTIILTPDL